MRPRGEIRAALAAAFRRLVQERGLVVDGQAVDGVSWRDAAISAQVGFEAAQRTVENMVRAGELVRVSASKRAGSQHWEGLYAPPPPTPAPACEPDGLDAVMRRLHACR